MTATFAVIVCALLLNQHIQARDFGVYDMGRAREICDSLPLEPIEGIWVYPEDNVTVLVTRCDLTSSTAFPTYDLHIVETSDCKLRPGEKIGVFEATPDVSKYRLVMFTHRKKGLLTNPESCLARISSDGETILVNKEKKGLKLRFSFNPSILLPKLWRIIRIGTSSGGTKQDAPIGLVKIYPSYDGNGSTQRKPRYL